MRKKTEKVFIGLVMVFAVLIGTVVTSRVALSVSEGARDYTLRVLSEHLDKNPNTELALKLADIVLGLDTNSLGSATLTRDTESTNFNEVGLIDNTSRKVRVDGWYYDTMPAVGSTTTTVYFQNKLGTPLWVDIDETFVQFAGTASSSVDVSVGTSTVSGLALYTTDPPNGIIQAHRIATSTVGLNEVGLVMSTTTKGLALLKENEYVIFSWRQPDSNKCTGVFCEAVTSTNRGYTATTSLKYFYLADY